MTIQPKPATSMDNTVSINLASLATSLAAIADAMTILAGQSSAEPAIASAKESAPKTPAATDNAAVSTTPTASTPAVGVVTTATASTTSPSTATGTTSTGDVAAADPSGAAAPDTGSNNNLLLVPHVATVSAPAQPPTLPLGLPASATVTFPQLTTAGTRWYVVTRGLQTGVFQGWHNTQGLVSGVANACFQKYPSEALARTAYMEAWSNGAVQNLN